MMLIRKRAYARAGLLGNPSDGYNGKTISISVRNFWAEVVLYEWDTVDIVLAEDDRARFSSIYDLASDVKLHGYYGGIRLIKATIKRFVDYCDRRGIAVARPQFFGAVRNEYSASSRAGGIERDHRRDAAVFDGILRRRNSARGATQFGPRRRKRRPGHRRQDCRIG